MKARQDSAATPRHTKRPAPAMISRNRKHRRYPQSDSAEYPHQCFSGCVLLHSVPESVRESYFLYVLFDCFPFFHPSSAHRSCCFFLYYTTFSSKSFSIFRIHLAGMPGKMVTLPPIQTSRTVLFSPTEPKRARIAAYLVRFFSQPYFL